jgi:hypothetical protein
VIRYIIDNRPEDWARLETIYDKDGIYRIAYLKEKEEVIANTTATVISLRSAEKL